MTEHEATAVQCDAMMREAACVSPCTDQFISSWPDRHLHLSVPAGKPKGVVHCTGGYMVNAHTTTKYVFNMQPGDVYWCTADCGWITGHTYLTYGPLLVGATQVVFEGVPTYPGPDRCWKIVDKYSVKQFYTAPTAIRSLMRAGDLYVKEHLRDSLRILGSVGEPINPEVRYPIGGCEDWGIGWLWFDSSLLVWFPVHAADY